LKDSSLREEINRILEFSRTVGLCNYSTSPRQSILPSPAPRLNSEPGVGVMPPVSPSLTRTPQPLDPPRRRNRNFMSLMSELSGGQPADTRIGHGVQGSGTSTSKLPERRRLTTLLIENSQMSQNGNPWLNSLNGESSPSQRARVGETVLECAGPASDDEYLEPWVSQSPAHSISTPQLGREELPAGLSERSLYAAGPSAPSFDPLEFPTSPLPPSSPWPSTATYGSVLSLCQTSHGAGTTLLDFDNTSLPFTVGGSCGDSSSSRSCSSYHMPPDLGSASPSRRLPHSALADKVPMLLASPPKADIISDLLMRNDPWNDIGEILGLPPIPPADATYFGKILSLDARSRERIAAQASSSSRRVDTREHSDIPRGDDTWSGSEHSGEDIIMRPDSSQHWFSRDASSRSSSPLSYLDSPEKRAVSPAPPVRSIRESHSPSPSISGSFLVLSEAPRSLLEPQTSPRPPEDDIRTPWQNSSASVQSFSPFPHILTPGGPTQPSPKHLNSPKPSISRSPGVQSTPWDIITGLGLFELMPGPQSTESQRPKLEGPDLFQDDSDSLEGDL